MNKEEGRCSWLFLLCYSAIRLFPVLYAPFLFLVPLLSPAAKAPPPEDPHLGRLSVGIAKTLRHPLGPALSYF